MDGRASGGGLQHKRDVSAADRIRREDAELAGLRVAVRCAARLSDVSAGGQSRGCNCDGTRHAAGAVSDGHARTAQSDHRDGQKRAGDNEIRENFILERILTH